MSVHDRWNGARTGVGRRYEVRWREAGVQRKQRFSTKPAALDFDADRRLSPEEHVRQPKQTTVAQLMETWLSTTTGLRPKTQDTYGTDVRQVVLEFGGRLATGVKPSEVRAWAARPGLGASARRRALEKMRAAYRLAIADGLVKVDPTEGAALPKVVRPDMRCLTWTELDRLAAAAGRQDPRIESSALVWLLGTCGLRIGEAIGVEGADVDRKRMLLRVRRSYTVSSKGARLGPVKGGQARDVPIDDDLLAMLPARLGPMFVGVQGARLSPGFWRSSVFGPAALAAGLGPMHPHELRHTAASLAIASGADVKVVQRMLGHASAAMTLDLYGHLFETQLAKVAERMRTARRDELKGRIEGA